MSEQEEVKKQKKLDKWFNMMRRIHRVFVYPLFPFKKYGHTERYNDGAYIFVGNHLSLLDVVFPVMATDRAVHFMAKKELFEKGAGKWFTKKCDCIPVARDGSDVKAIMQAMKCLKSGQIVCIFPEGTRNKTDQLFLPFHSGAAALAIKTKTPIVFFVQIAKTKLFKRSRVYYSEPFEFTEFYGKKLTPEDTERADEILREKMEEYYHKLEEILRENKKKGKSGK